MVGGLGWKGMAGVWLRGSRAWLWKGNLVGVCRDSADWVQHLKFFKVASPDQYSPIGPVVIACTPFAFARLVFHDCWPLRRAVFESAGSMWMSCLALVAMNKHRKLLGMVVQTLVSLTQL